jgi:hypothetical protein
MPRASFAEHHRLATAGAFDLATALTSACAPVTIESQIIDFLCCHHGKLFCHPCIRRTVTLADLREVETALNAISRAATFRGGDAECSICHGTRPVVGTR